MMIILANRPWYNKNDVWVTGFIHSENRYLLKGELLNYFNEIDTLSSFENILKTANGQFSVVMKKDNEIWAATDRLRSWPLFYTSRKGEFIISDDCYKLAEMQTDKQFDQDAVASFLATGYVLNKLTLIKNIYQVEAGSYVVLGNTSMSKFYHDVSRETINDNDIKTGAEKSSELLQITFRNHLNALKDKFIAIPLSGGFDSRLVASMVARYHPGNVLCYTYGIKDNKEVAPAKEVAKRLNLKWINIVYDSELIKDFLHDDFFNKYYPFVSNLTSMFFMQEYFAVRYLKKYKLIPDDSVFISGFSGDLLAGSYLTAKMKNQMDREKISGLIFREYFRLVKLNKVEKASAIKMIGERIPDTVSEPWKIIEMWDIKERHAKFIVNSAKVFSFFGYDYVFPLWDNMLVDYFLNLPFSLKLNRRLYEYTLKEYFFKDLDLNLKDEINPLPLQKKFQRFKESIKTSIPVKIRDLFINMQSPILYDEITKILLEEIDQKMIVPPAQPNYYNSYLTQWYLIKTQEHFNIRNP
jgi:asparagine synthase (glutamine-hydrolysing)